MLKVLRWHEKKARRGNGSAQALQNKLSQQQYKKTRSIDLDIVDFFSGALIFIIYLVRSIKDKSYEYSSQNNNWITLKIMAALFNKMKASYSAKREMKYSHLY